MDDHDRWIFFLRILRILHILLTVYIYSHILHAVYSL